MAGPVLAEVLETPAVTAETGAKAVMGPQRGASMTEVRRQFGEPNVKHDTVGGSSRRQPPITRWDYADFSVVFERDKVVDITIKGEPLPVQNPGALTAPSP